MAAIQFGFILPAEIRNLQMRDPFMSKLTRALDLVQGQFDSVWMIDHLQFGDVPILESFTTLAYFSSLYPGLRFGHSVLCQSFRSPALLAKMAATLQFLSGGRYILGIGAGWHEEEYRAYGYEFPSGSVRVDQLDEALHIIQALWTGQAATFKGDYYQVANAHCEPRPDPLPLVMVGAFKPRMLRLTARYADWWNASSTGITAYRQMSAELDRACAEIDRDPSTIRRTWGGGCACAPTQQQAEAFMLGHEDEEDDENFDFIGTPSQLVDQMGPFIESGVDYFMLDCGGFPNLTTLEMLVHEVLPILNA